MPTATYIALANLTVSGSSDSTIEFTSIPATYRDLVLIMNTKGASGATYGILQVNSDTGNNYSRVYMYNDNNTTKSEAYSSEAGYYGWNIGSDFSTVRLNFMDYSATDKHKTFLSGSAMTPANQYGVLYGAGRWASTNAITTIKLTLGTGNFAVDSTFALYGIVS